MHPAARRIVKVKVFAGLMLGLACAGCASDVCLSLISCKVHQTPRAEVVDRISPTTNDGGLLASSFYYGRQPPPVSQAFLGRFGARARREGCFSGAVPRRRHVVTEPGKGTSPLPTASTPAIDRQPGPIRTGHLRAARQYRWLNRRYRHE
jgi:hypothetical protein